MRVTIVSEETGNTHALRDTNFEDPQTDCAPFLIQQTTGIHTVWPAYTLVPKEACRIHRHTIRPCFVHPCLTRVPSTPCDAHAHTRPSNHNLFLRVQIIIASLWLLRWWDQNGMSGVKRVLARMCKTIAASPSRRKRTHTCAKITCGAPFRWSVWVRPQGRRGVLFLPSLLVVFCNTDGLENSNRVLQL